MKRDLNELKKITNNFKENSTKDKTKIEEIENFMPEKFSNLNESDNNLKSFNNSDKYSFAEEVIEEETLSIQDKELELIIKALERNNGKRKAAANELGISERTLYRKIKQYDIQL